MRRSAAAAPGGAGTGPRHRHRHRMRSAPDAAARRTRRRGRRAIRARAQCSRPRRRRHAASGLRVLVVEDNLDSQYLVCEMLKAFGHEAHGIAHAEGALGLLAQARYDVLFSDVSLPGISGVELARQALGHAPGMHVIFASGYGESLLRHVEFPFQSLQKPYEIEQLQAALAAIPARGQACQRTAKCVSAADRAGLESA
ncbi:response regulator [Massilia sp. H-1]|nr:response regulator [Massilia sp. H-1]